MKKNVFVWIAMLALTTAMFTGCKKDKEPGNYLEINGTSYGLDWGLYELMGVNATQGYYGVCLCSYGMAYSSEDSWSGTGNYIWLELFSSSTQGITSGSYTYDDNTNPSFTFDDYCYWGLNWNLPGYSEAYLSDGIIDVQDNGDGEYEITIDCEDAEGNTVRGHFKGTLDFYDYTRSKSAVSLRPLLK